MLELRLLRADLLKKLLEAVKDLVNDANFDCSSTGFSLQAMDTSHVALVSLLLRSDGFDHFRCDRNLAIGMNLGNVSKMLKCAGNEDIVTIKADDGGDSVTFMFESPNQDKISDFEMKLMDIDSEHLGIPETEYQAIVKMPSAEFARICKDLSTIGDTVVISVTKEGVKFSTRGDIGAANIVCRHNTSVEKPEESTIIKMEEPVSLSFALRYMNSFAKATPLSNQVTFSLSQDFPIAVEYKVGEAGYIRFYLAPKLEEDENIEMPNAQEEARPQPAKKPKVDKETVPSREANNENGAETEVETQVEADAEPEVKIKVEAEPQPKVEVEDEVNVKVKSERKRRVLIKTDDDDDETQEEIKPEVMDVE